jgi:hypothetical protein
VVFWIFNREVVFVRVKSLRISGFSVQPARTRHTVGKHTWTKESTNSTSTGKDEPNLIWKREKLTDKQILRTTRMNGLQQQGTKASL